LFSIVPPAITGMVMQGGVMFVRFVIVLVQLRIAVETEMASRVTMLATSNIWVDFLQVTLVSQLQPTLTLLVP
jgi:hypothetical protein